MALFQGVFHRFHMESEHGCSAVHIQSSDAHECPLARKLIFQRDVCRVVSSAVRACAPTTFTAWGVWSGNTAALCVNVCRELES